MRNASAKSLAMKAPSNNNLPSQTNDVIFNPQNPVNPDSKPQITGIIWKLTLPHTKKLAPSSKS